MNKNQAAGFVKIAAMILLMAVMSGCVGYRLGSSLPNNIKTIHVPTFINQANQPLLEAETTSATIQEFQRDGTLSITGPEYADTTLEVILSSYKLVPLRYDKDNNRNTKEYRVVITGNIVFKRKNGEVLTMAVVEGESTFSPKGDLSSAKREALPKAARDFAHHLVEQVVEYW